MYSERIIAFIDILGFKEVVKSSEKDKHTLSVILDAISYLKKFETPSNWGIQTIEIEESAQKKDLEKFVITHKVRCSCFSDSIVVSVSFDDDSINEAFSTLVANISAVGAKLLTEGVLIRGGITIGNLIHEENGTIIGQGLIDAYKLENSSAIYPRIIISKKLIDKTNYPIDRKSDSYPYHQYLKRYSDGCVGFSQLRYFQVLQSWVGYSDEKLKHELRKAKKTIVDALNSNFEEPKVYEKLIWLKNEYDNLVILEAGLKEDIKPIMENTIHYPL